MTKQQVIEHYGSMYATAKALGISHQAVQKWGEYPPAMRQFQLEIMTDGKLKATRR